MKKLLLAVALGTTLSASATAATMTYTLADIGTFGGYTTTNVGQTFTGTGFVGMYSGNTFGHLFTLEGSNARTVAQIDVSALAGATVTSATLSFQLLDGSDAPTTTITSYAGNGALGYQFSAPTAAYGAVTGTSQLGANSFDLTSILNNALDGGEDWLNLHFAGSTCCVWTYTYAGYGNTADRAQMRLTVNYEQEQVPVPEPAMLGLLGTGVLGIAAARRRRKAA